MKILLCGITLFISLIAQASILEVATDVQAHATVNSISVNKDGSVSVRDIKVKRGDSTYSIGMLHLYDFELDAVCKLLSFDQSVSGEGLNTLEKEEGVKVILNLDGTFKKTKKWGSKVQKVTCVKSGQLKTVVSFDRVKNEDNSSTLTDIIYHRGDLNYPIGGSEFTFNPTCMLIGFENVLSGEGLNTLEKENGFKVMLNNDGTFKKTKDLRYKIKKVTCFSGREPDLIVLVGGNRYMRVTP